MVSRIPKAAAKDFQVQGLSRPPLGLAVFCRSTLGSAVPKSGIFGSFPKSGIFVFKFPSHFSFYGV
eukprot:4250573-Prymnesium_polylepis.1